MLEHWECLHLPHLVFVPVVLHFAEPHLALLLTSKESRGPPKFFSYSLSDLIYWRKDSYTFDDQISLVGCGYFRWQSLCPLKLDMTTSYILTRERTQDDRKNVCMCVYKITFISVTWHTKNNERIIPKIVIELLWGNWYQFKLQSVLNRVQVAFSSLKFYLSICVHMYARICMCIHGGLLESNFKVDFSPSTMGIISGCHAWWQELLLVEPCRQLTVLCLRRTSYCCKF